MGTRSGWKETLLRSYGWPNDLPIGMSVGLTLSGKGLLNQTILSCMQHWLKSIPFAWLCVCLQAGIKKHQPIERTIMKTFVYLLAALVLAAFGASPAFGAKKMTPEEQNVQPISQTNDCMFIKTVYFEVSSPSKIHYYAAKNTGQLIQQTLPFIIVSCHPSTPSLLNQVMKSQKPSLI